MLFRTKLQGPGKKNYRAQAKRKLQGSGKKNSQGPGQKSTGLRQKIYSDVTLPYLGQKRKPQGSGKKTL